MGAALMRVDGVGEGVDGLGVGVVPLHRDFESHALRVGAEVDDRVVRGGLRRVEVLDEVLEPTLVVVDLLLRHLVALVAQGDGQAGVEERHLLQPARQRLERVRRRLEDRGIGPEGRGRAGGRGGRPLPELAIGLTAVDIGAVPDKPVALDLHLEPG